jgi:hypothetical protein
VLKICESCLIQEISYQEDLRFLPDTLTLVARITSIYYPNEKAPMEKALLGNVFNALLEINRQVIEVLELPGLEMLTQFRMLEVSPAVVKNENKEQR